MREQDELSEQFALDQNRRVSDQQRALEAAARERRMFDLEQIATTKEYEKKKGVCAGAVRARTSYCRKRTRRTARVHEQCASSLDREMENREARFLEDRNTYARA